MIVLIYIKYGGALSNRRMFSKNFIILGMTTMLIITIVKSSLALSLGLVGALSIVRFRAAIKEPEELAYLFLIIAVGLGFGADQKIITIIAFLIIVTILYLNFKFSLNTKNEQAFNLTITIPQPDKNDLENIVEILHKHCNTVNLRRFDESNKILESVFFVEFDKFKSLSTTKNDIIAFNDLAEINFLDSSRII